MLRFTLRDLAFVGQAQPTTNGISAPEASIFYFDADQISANPADLEYLDTWDDLSPSSRTVTTPGVTTSRPRFHADADGNGNPAVEVGATLSSRFEFTNISDPITTTEMMMVIEAFADPAVASREGPIMISNDAAGNDAWPFTDGNIFSRYGAETATSGTYLGSVTKPGLLTQPRLCHVVSAPDRYEVYYDGELLFYGDVNTVGFGLDLHQIGTAQPNSGRWPGYVYTLFGYGRELSVSERSENNDMLFDKYSIVDNSDPIPWDPDVELATGLQGHWDISSLVGLSDLDPIPSMPDLAGSNNWAQATGGLRPIYRTGIQGGLPVARFTGSEWFDGPSIAIGASSPFTVVMVASFTADSSILSNNVSNVQLRGRRGGGNTMAFFAGSPEVFQGITGRSSTNVHMYVWRRVVTTNLIKFMQGSFRITGSSNAGAFTINRFGLQPFGISFQGDFCEGWMWDRELSDREIFKLYGYHIRSKWSLVAV